MSKNGHEERTKMKRKEYEKELVKLQTELCRLQDWVVHKGLRVIIVFEGRDAAGKGGTIKALLERTSPRVFRLIALPAPVGSGKTQLYASDMCSIFRGRRSSSSTEAGTIARRRVCHGFLYQRAV